VLVQRVAAGVEHRVGQAVVLAVEAQQPGHGHGPLVHPPPLGPPRHGPRQPFEQAGRPGEPATLNIDPGAVGERLPRRPQPPGGGHIAEVEQRVLYRNTHANTLSYYRKWRSISLS
jgi:hypothetical protein